VENRKLTMKWGVLELKCGKCGADFVIENTPRGCFYKCSQYPNCYNKMNATVYEKILDKITDLLMQHPDSEMNFTGYKWKFRNGYHCYIFEVQKHYPDRFVITVRNIKN